jgi:para-aminobenzoate synthetase component 1
MKKAETLMNEWGKHKIPFLFIIDFECKEPIVLRLDQVGANQIQYQFRSKGNASSQLASLPSSIQFDIEPIDFFTYQMAFQKAQSAIFEGNSYLLNLTFPTPIQTNLSLYQIFQNSTAPYRLWMKDQLVVFSPEPFVKIENGQIASYPMKGTIDADLPAAEAVLMANQKERAEHATIVDLIRNDLNMVAKKVRVERYRFLDRIETNRGNILQTSTKIVGEVGEDYHQRIGTILRKLLPAGSISGAPKKKTVEIIQSAEPFERGFYTGVMGLFDGENLDSAVMIRFIEQQGAQKIFKSGGGITSQSDVMEEYQELIKKVYLPFVSQSKMLTV